MTNEQALSQEPCEDDRNNLCSSCTNIGCEFQSGIVRTKCAFYMPPHIETDNCGNYVVMQPVRPQEPCDDAISRQAVLDTLDRMDKTLDVDRTVENYKDLLKECYQVLPSVNSQPCEDAISRDAVIGLVAREHTEWDDLYIDIAKLPSVTHKSGVWVEIDDEPHEVWECDHCGFVIDGSGCIEPYEYRDIYKYCPNCGCRMVEPQESEDR